MAKFLVTFNYVIDDVELNGFTVMSDKEIEEYEELAYSITWPFVYKIGETELEFSSGDDLLTRLDYKELSFEDSKSMKKIFNNDFGTFIGFDTLENVIDGEEGYDDDEEDDEDDDGYDSSYYNDDDDYDDNY